MTTSKSNAFRNVPPPPGSKGGGAYTRFIPREELGDFASWRPDAFNGQTRERPGRSAATDEAPAAAPEPTAAQWQQRLTAARQAGYEEGYRDGLVALESFKQSFAQQATSQIGALLDAFDEQFQQLDAQVAQAVARTAVQLAQQVLRAELQQRPELVAKVATEAIHTVMLSARHIAVHVHPLDLPLVAEGAQEALSARGARLHADASVARGGVMVQSEMGDIDARIAARWAQAAASLGHGLDFDDDGSAPGQATP